MPHMWMWKLVWILAAFATACALALGTVLLALAADVGGSAFWRAIAALSFVAVAAPLLWVWWQRLFPDRWPR